MDIIVLTGAGAEPAQSIARRLVANGARVYALANKLPDKGFAHRDFIPVGVNPADPASVRDAVDAIVAKEGAVGAVILAGHNPVEDAFEAAHPNDVVLSVFAGIAAPLAAVRAALPGLIRRRGLVMAITRPVFGPGAALGGVVEAAQAAFCDGLFGELRDTGVRVSHIRLQENPGAGDPAARFTQSPQSRVQPDIVADTVEAVLRLRENNAITRLVLRPQATREEPRLPVTSEPRLAALQVVQLPTAENYPAPEEKILTPRYRRPDYAPPPEDKEIEPDDDSDDSVDPELAYLIKPSQRARIVRDDTPAPAPRARDDARGRWSDAAPEEHDRHADEHPFEGGEDDEAAPEPAEHEAAEAPAAERAPRSDAPGYRQPPRRDEFRDARDQRDREPPHRHPLGTRDNRPPKPGAVRLQPPITSNPAEPAAPRVDLHPGYRAKQEELARQRRESGEPEPRSPQAQPGRPPRPYEQMPRPPGWQGPRMPQPQNNQPQRPGDRPHRDDRRDPRDHRFRDAAPADATPPAESAPAPTDAPAPADAPAATSDAPVAPAPKPVVLPVIIPHEVSPESGDKPASGRSEAVTLAFTPPAPRAAEPAPAPAETPAPADAESASDDKPKRKPAAKKPAAKPAKAAKSDEPAPEAGEPPAAPEAPAADSTDTPAAKPAAKRGRPRKS